MKVGNLDGVAMRYRNLVVVCVSLLLAGCGATQIAMHGDADPHSGVDRARSMPVQGIDISKYQGDIDWARVGNAGIRFAYLKVSEGGDHVDHRFYENWEGAADAGIARGAYHFMYWCRTAAEQAVWFTQAVPQDPTQLPPVLDAEWNHASETCPQQTTPEDARAKIRKMLEIMEYHTGKRPVIYTDIAFHRDVLEGHFSGYEFWLRSVAAEPHERFSDRPWTFWQYTATGRVPGIKGDVDRNAFNGTESEWRSWLRRNGVASDTAVGFRRTEDSAG
jgi:lysozyme